jgi:precorrin-6A/cobalt-precorrin-6A reductase
MPVSREGNGLIMLVAGIKEAPEIMARIIECGCQVVVYPTNSSCRHHIIDAGLGCHLLPDHNLDLMQFVNDQEVKIVIDASSESSSGLFEAINQITPAPRYIRYYREELELPVSPLLFTVYSFADAVDKLVEIGARNVFLTTGSYCLDSFCNDSRLQGTRFVVRVLPDWKIVKKCQDIGIPIHDIVAMQGPFSRKINKTLFKTYNADVVVTRDSGKMGGADTKISAALDLNLTIVVIKRKTSQQYPTACGIKQLMDLIQR